MNMSHQDKSKDSCKVIWETYSEDEFPFCTLLAMAKAICDYGLRINRSLHFDEVRRSLLQSLTLKQPDGATNGWHPQEFDGINLPLITSGEEETNIEYGNLEIKVKKVPSCSFQFEEEYVLMDHRNSQDKCMKVICKMKMGDIKYYLCRQNTSISRGLVEKVSEVFYSYTRKKKRHDQNFLQN